jgi:hypothetical protein
MGWRNTGIVEYLDHQAAIDRLASFDTIAPPPIGFVCTTARLGLASFGALVPGDGWQRQGLGPWRWSSLLVQDELASFVQPAGIGILQ